MLMKPGWYSSPAFL